MANALFSSLHDSLNRRCCCRVPEIIDVEETKSASVTAAELHTALHEIVHALGGVGPGYADSSPFLTSNGSFASPSDVYSVREAAWVCAAYPRVASLNPIHWPIQIGNDDAYGYKPATYIITPKVGVS